MTVTVQTLGCKLNQYEGESIASSFRAGGFEVSHSPDGSALFILNGCTVTSKSEQKARRLVRKFLRENKSGIALVTGCWIQANNEHWKNLGSRVRGVPQENKPLLLQLPRYLSSSLADGNPFTTEVLDSFLEQRLYDKWDSAGDPFEFSTDRFARNTRAYLKIQDGCANSCTFCRTTIARGEPKSLPPEEVDSRLYRLSSDGYREVILTGINIGSYDSEGVLLSDLLQHIISCNYGLRIRLSSLEPENITPELVSVIEDSAICPHFHIAVQSGSERILKSMARRGGREAILRGVELLRSAKKDPFIAADVIVGFPGEREEDFEDTLSLLTQSGFSSLHVFTYSPREGTVAAEYKDRIPERVARERANRLGKLSKELHNQYRHRQLGRVFSFLIEKEGDGREGRWLGTSENNLKETIILPTVSRGELVMGRLRLSSTGEFHVSPT